MGRLRHLALAAVVCGTLALPLPAHATAQSISNVGTAWSPQWLHVAVGDTVQWNINPGCTTNCAQHSVVQFAGTPPFLNSGVMTTGSFPTTPLAVSGPMSVWYSSRPPVESKLDSLTQECIGLCGGFTTLISVAVPTVTSPSEGASASAPNSIITISGTADPFVHILISEGVKKYGGTYSDAAGAWSVSATFTKGAHSVTAKATSAAHDSATATRSFTVLSEPNGPVMTLDVIPPGPISMLRPLTGTGGDESAIAVVVIEAWNGPFNPADPTRPGTLQSRIFLFPPPALGGFTCTSQACNNVSFSVIPARMGLLPAYYEFRTYAYDVWGNITYPFLAKRYVVAV
jgi:hypothetical protein